MKTSSVSLYILTATLFAVPALAQNEPGPVPAEPDRSGPMSPRHQEMIKRFDKNGDGKLDEVEKAAAHAAMRKEGNGGLDKRGREGEGQKRILKRFDKDGDGKLNDAERAEAQKAREERMKNGGLGDGKKREEILKRFDQDGDGRLNDAERAEAEKAREEIQPPREKKPAGP